MQNETPICDGEIKRAVNNECFYEFVYIEDNKYERRHWERNAKAKGIKLLVLKSTRDFEKHTGNISKEETHIYLDCDLGEGETRGDEFAKVLNKQGYSNLYMASSYDKECFKDLTWLKYVGKGCPFAEKEEF